MSQNAIFNTHLKNNRWPFWITFGGNMKNPDQNMKMSNDQSLEITEWCSVVSLTLFFY